ncbi:MAG: hypothetical protein JXB88_25660 [Spirochaetales bacterium]|nr:hypothetical protein [Spirochaetales bacterium]
MPIIIYGVAVFLFSTLLGIFTFAASDMPLAVREIAMNTRKREDNGSHYAFLKIMSVAIKVFAVLTWLSGIIISFIIVYQNRLF